MHTMKPGISDHGPTQHCTGGSQVLSAILSVSIEKEHQIIRVCPKERDEEGEKSQGQD